jgi:hypothetical protein
MILNFYRNQGGAVPVTYAKDDIRLEAEYTFAEEQFRIQLKVKNKSFLFIFNFFSTYSFMMNKNLMCFLSVTLT